jgi:hypothetical protein
MTLSVSLVPDPLTGPSPEALAAAFPVCRPFKTHYLIDREAGPIRFGNTHRKQVNRSYRALDITATDIRRNDGEWIRTYQHTVERHGVTGIANFAPCYFAALAKMTETTVVAAFREDRMVAMAVWIRSGDIAYGHIGGASDVGHQFYAMYGIIATATMHFADCRVLHLGGGGRQRGRSRGRLGLLQEGLCQPAGHRPPVRRGAGRAPLWPACRRPVPDRFLSRV